ncbi:MAG TPA: aminoacyl-tRNA deacylase [Mycobacterium sp.]|nr:aminoacyl-tRNA deacylase [Mycobacterium sp.]
MTRAATRAIAALAAAQVPHRVLRYHHDPRRRSFGAEAVEQLAGADPGPTDLAAMQVFKTLIVAIPPGLAVAVLPVPSKLSLKAVAAALGVARASMADPAVAERSTGYVVGGISPFGQRTTLPTVVDASALGWDRVACSAGQRGWDVSVAPQDLIRLTGAVTADICA